MKSPVSIFTERFDAKLRSVDPGAPDLLVAESSKQYKKAAAYGAIAMGAYTLNTLGYQPSEDLQMEYDIASTLGLIGGSLGFVYHGSLGFFNRFIADKISLQLMDDQLEHVDSGESEDY